jgi:hypothetical protein
MDREVRRDMSIVLTSLLVFGAFAGLVRTANAQNPEMQQRVAEIKEASAKNKQALMSYSWNQQVTISLKGEVKKVQHYQVRLGPDGQQQKTSLDPPTEAAPPSGGRMKQKIVAKKKEEYQDYAESMKALAQQYAPPDPAKIQQAAAAGNITLGTVAGATGQVQLVIHNYLKSGDSMTLVFDKAQKSIVSVQIASYMDDPKDAMNLTVQYSKLPDGTNHIDSIVVDGVSKQLNVAIKNANYAHV